MTNRIHCLLIATLYLYKAAGFAGLEMIPHAPAAAAFLEQSSTTTLASSALAVGSNLLGKYTQTLTVHPLETKMATGATLAVVGDAVAQFREPEPYDQKRAFAFMVFDVCYRAVQHWVYPPMVAACQGQWILGALASIPALATFTGKMDPYFFGTMEQTLVSQLVIIPLIYYPVFFALTGFVQGLTVEQTIERAKETFVPLMERNLLFWIPVQFMVFSFIKEQDLQIPLLCIAGLVWTSILSVMAGSTKHYCVTGMEDECILPDELFITHEVDDLLEEEIVMNFNDEPINGEAKKEEEEREATVLR